MNNLREGLAALDCHIIFFLPPGSYRKFLQLADHLADWTPLKLHIMEDADGHDRMDARAHSIRSVSEGSAAAHSATKLLADLEAQLVRALQNGVETSALIRRYYLPMFQAAVSINDIHRANSLRHKIIDMDVSEPDRPQWYELNFNLDLMAYRLPEAENWALKLKEWGENKNNHSGKAVAYHQLGRIAQERRDFDSAETWYRKSLAIKEKQGNEHGAAGTYGQMGVLSGIQENYDESGNWFIRSIANYMRFHDEDRTATSIKIFLVTFKNASPDIQDKLRIKWRESGIGAFPEG